MRTNSRNGNINVLTVFAAIGGNLAVMVVIWTAALLLLYQMHFAFVTVNDDPVGRWLMGCIMIPGAALGYGILWSCCRFKRAIAWATAAIIGAVILLIDVLTVTEILWPRTEMASSLHQPIYLFGITLFGLVMGLLNRRAAA